MAEDRWQQITSTTNSGRTMFVCRSCGRKTDAPNATCPQPAEVDWGGKKFYVPCEFWPMDPEEYVAYMRSEDKSDACVFSGVLVLPDGSVVKITCPVSEDVARQINMVNAEWQLMQPKLEEQRRQEREERNREIGALAAQQASPSASPFARVAVGSLGGLLGQRAAARAGASVANPPPRNSSKNIPLNSKNK